METRHYYYPANVQFIGDYFAMNHHVTVSVDGDEDLHTGEIEDRAIQQAAEFLEDYYGWDVETVSKQIDVDLGIPY